MLYRIEGVGFVSHFMHCLQNIAGLALRCIPAHLQLLGGDIQVDCGKPGHLRQTTLDQPHACSATNTLNGERSLSATISTGELCSKLRNVIQLECLRNRLSHALRQTLSGAVEIGQAIVDNRLCNRLATRAAHGLLDSINLYRPSATRGHRQAAMKAV